MKKLFSTAFTSVFLAFMCSFACAQESVPTLEQRLSTAQAGDYIVTAQEGNYSLLSLKALTPDVLLFEEISVPQKQFSEEKVDWKKWVQEKAPGHTSWTLTEIDRKTGVVIECFSYSKNGWLFLDTSEQLFAKLLMLPLSSVTPQERKKIGPPPSSSETDQRALWNPPLVIEGKKMEKPSFDVVKAEWPDDGSRLALCHVELYFAKQKLAPAFPYWLEIQSPHYAFKMRTVDSGHGLISPMQGGMPHRPPQFLNATQKGKQSWKITIRTPSYFEKLRLFALDISGSTKESLPIPFTLQSAVKEEKVLEIPVSALNTALKAGHRYKWVLVPVDRANIHVESEEIFTW